MRWLQVMVDAECEGLTVREVLRSKASVSERIVRRAKSREGSVLLDDAPSRLDARVFKGQLIRLAIDDELMGSKETAIEAEEGPLDIVYEDEDVILVNKQPGQVVHPSPGHSSGTLVNFMMAHFSKMGCVCNPHPVQRLDLETSGLLVFAKSGYVQDRLQASMHTREFARTYLALCEGSFEQLRGTIDVPTDRLTRAPSTYGVCAHGKPSITHYQVVGEFALQEPRVDGRGAVREAALMAADAREELPVAENELVRPTDEDKFAVPGARLVSLVCLQLETGRTHQIRVHMESVGHPLLGDATYGSASPHIGRAALHSWRVNMENPLTQLRLDVRAPLPKDMASLIPSGLIEKLG